MKTDVLVLGSGSAGLTFALEVAERSNMQVLVITKKDRSESNTNYAQGGIASVMAPFDSFEAHIRDTLVAGAGLCHEEAVRILVLEGPERIRDLMARGASFTKNAGGSLHLGKEGGHSTNRIVHTKDLTGKEIERTLLEAVAAHPRIRLLENHYAVELITEHNLLQRSTKSSRTCFGAYVLDDLTKKVHIVYAQRAVMLATGGCGQVYLHSTNPLIATGDGIAMAYRAGARIANMEFVQFHPTSLYAEGSRSYLISEAVRGAGGILLNLAGERFMVDYDAERMELAPRDIVARAIDAELKKRGDSHVLLDISHLGTKVKKEFPTIYAKCLEFNIDITREPIPVVPAAHYSCGGVVTDLNGRTDIGRLYSCGETAMTGVHGANRLASNSLLESLVFSRRAAIDLVTTAKGKLRMPDIRPWDESGTENAEEWVVIEHDRREVQQLMWDYVGIVRSTSRLKRAERRLKLIRKEIEDYYRKTRVTMPLVELRNIAETALIIIRSALSRKESRGLHYTTDFPAQVAYLGKRDTIIAKRLSHG
jgi:L-aspartate oxidase